MSVEKVGPIWSISACRTASGSSMCPAPPWSWPPWPWGWSPPALPRPLSFKLGEDPILVVTAGDAKNRQQQV